MRLQSRNGTTVSHNGGKHDASAREVQLMASSVLKNLEDEDRLWHSKQKRREKKREEQAAAAISTSKSKPVEPLVPRDKRQTPDSDEEIIPRPKRKPGFY